MIRFLKTHFWVLVFLLATNTVMAQKQITVKGVTVDKDTHLPRADVDIFATKPDRPLGATKSDGSFEITITAGSVVRFMAVGLEQINRSFSEKDTGLVRIEMRSTQNPMNEVVVTGFKRVRREAMTGASTVISGKDIQDVPVTNITQLIQGRVAGLNVQINSGAPGARTPMFLRGLSDASVIGSGSNAFITPTSPLFVVDGVQIDDNANYSYGFDQAGPGVSPLSAIPPEDVENIEVLKDASATAMYGSRGAYGVILITTKRGNSSVPIIRYTSNYFMNAIPKLREVLGGRGERDVRLKQIMQYDSTYAAALALINTNYYLSDSLSPYFNNSVNWQKVFFKPTFNMSQNIDASGGSQKFNYKVNLGYYKERGIIKNTGLTRYSLNMNSQYQPDSSFRMLVSMNSSMLENQKGTGVGLTQNGVASNQEASTLLPPPSTFSENNAAVASFAVRDNNKTAQINTNLDIQWEPIRHLRLGANGSYSVISATSDNFVPAYVNDGVGQTTSYNSRSTQVYNRNTISWINSYNDVHNFNVYAFSELAKKNNRENIIIQKGTANDNIEGPFGYNPLASKGRVPSYGDVRTLAYGGSFSYNYKLKYVLDVGIRLDGTSINGPNSAWRRNPTIGLRWNFNKEKFLINQPWLDYGSFRFSWGRSIIPVGSIYDVYGKYLQGPGYNGSASIQNSWDDNIPNPGFIPKTNTQFDWGMDIGLFHNFLNLTYDFYYKMVDNQLISKKIPNINGYTNVSSNEISQANYGHELSLNFRIFRPGRKFQWTLSANGAYNSEVLAMLPDAQRLMISSVKDLDNGNFPVLRRLGRQTFSNFLYITKGVYATDADVPVDPATSLRQRVLVNGKPYFFKAGDPRFVDLNGDYIIDDADRAPVGNPFPRLTGGVISFMTYRSFTLNIASTFTFLRDIINAAVAKKFQFLSSPLNQTVVVPLDQYNFWQKPGDIAAYPNPFDFKNYSAIQPYRYNQTLYLEDGGYFKISSITLSYNFNREYTRKYGISSCRVFLTAGNVYTFSRYKGPDPENVTVLGYDNSNGYPNRRSYTFGLNVQF